MKNRKGLSGVINVTLMFEASSLAAGEVHSGSVDQHIRLAHTGKCLVCANRVSLQCCGLSVQLTGSPPHTAEVIKVF